MAIRHEDLIGTYEQKRAVVAQLNLMDDTFFAVVMENNDAAEYLLSKLLGKEIKIIENKTQYSIRNAEGHSIVLDALVTDEDGKVYNVEIQVGDRNNHERRIRYYHAAIDWSFLSKGTDYSKLPDLYMIFISEFDPFNKNKPHYEIKHYVSGVDGIDGDIPEYDNGIYIHYFNTAVNDGTFISELLQYLKTSDPRNNKFGALSRQVTNFKNTNGGVDNMCKLVEDYAKERESIGKALGEAQGKAIGEISGKVETINNMLDDKIPLETALKYAKLDKETYEKYSKRSQ